jgi:GNAT superfamily N-acetyltransferase
MHLLDGALDPMEPSDVEVAASLVAEAMNADEGQWALRTMRFHFDCRKHDLDDGRVYYVWKRAGEIKGLAGLHQMIWGPPDNVWLAWFAVAPEFQGRGLGRELLRAVENLAVEKGYRKLLVETYDHPDFDKARRFYTSNGFQEAGRVSNYLPDGEAMVVYAKPPAVTR